jgi:hypothetical protein
MKSNYQKFTVLLFIIYMVGMTAFMIWQGIGIAPDRYALVLVLGSLLIKRARGFLLDWMPFLFILIAYDFLRGLAPIVNSNVHFVELIQADIFLFGVLPPAYLQSLFYNPNSLSFLDFFATIIYFLHFALPLSFGFLLWTINKQHFRTFVVSILLLSYAAWVTYVAYPAAPPWMAQRDGYITGVTKILDKTLATFPDKFNLPSIYHNFNPNPVAAMPSMHAAYPFLVFLFCLKFFRWKGLIFLPYLIAVWFSMVYLGEHYVIDELVGGLYAFAFFVLANWITSGKMKNQILKIKYSYGK